MPSFFSFFFLFAFCFLQKGEGWKPGAVFNTLLPNGAEMSKTGLKLGATGGGAKQHRSAQPGKEKALVDKIISDGTVIKRGSVGQIGSKVPRVGGRAMSGSSS